MVTWCSRLHERLRHVEEKRRHRRRPYNDQERVVVREPSTAAQIAATVLCRAPSTPEMPASRLKKPPACDLCKVSGPGSTTISSSSQVGHSPAGTPNDRFPRTGETSHLPSERVGMPAMSRKGTRVSTHVQAPRSKIGHAAPSLRHLTHMLPTGALPRLLCEEGVAQRQRLSEIDDSVTAIVTATARSMPNITSTFRFPPFRPPQACARRRRRPTHH